MEAVEPDVHLVATLLSLSRVMPNKTKETARMVVRRVVDELERKLANPLRQAVTGSLNRSVRNRRPRHNEINWDRTIRANLKHYQPEYKTIIPETRFGFGRRKSALRDIILCVDQSGSMATSVVYSSICAAVMASISAGPDADFVRMVEDGLRHFSDYIALGQSSLAEWAGIRAGSHVERGKQLQRLLADAMDAFCPGGPRPPEPLPRVWYNYVVLYDAYVEGVPNREIMARLYISEGTFHRTRRNAIRGLARMLVEKNLAA